MEKDFSKVRYLKFNAKDEFGPEFINVIIDLTTDKVIDGIIKVNDNDSSDSSDSSDNDKPRIIINGKNKAGNLICTKYNVFAKVVDSGEYYLLDEELTPVFKSIGYVPSLMDYYNNEPGYGDYIDLTFMELDRGKLKHANRPKINFNNVSEWEEI